MLTWELHIDLRKIMSRVRSIKSPALINRGISWMPHMVLIITLILLLRIVALYHVTHRSLGVWAITLMLIFSNMRLVLMGHLSILLAYLRRILRVKLWAFLRHPSWSFKRTHMLLELSCVRVCLEGRRVKVGLINWWLIVWVHFSAY